MPDKNIYSLTLVLPQKDGAALTRLAGLIAKVDGILVGEMTVLSPQKAIDIKFSAPSQNDVKKQIANMLETEHLKVDFCIQSSGNRRKRLLICDMDSTLIGQECIDELADYAGVKAHVSEITERAMRGELDFDQALSERVGLLKDLPLSNLQNCFDERIALNKGAGVLAATMKKHGAKTVIVSGGFTYFTERIAKMAGFEHNQANTLIDDGAVLTGKVGRPILGRIAKKDALENFSNNSGGPASAVAIGDGANDLAMIQAAGLGIAYKAKPIVAQAAQCAIDHTDLTTALYFQGFKDEDFA